MANILLFVEYAVLASIVVAAANILGQIVDEMDSRTNLSSAMIGGVILAAITSLPELMTSISSALIVKEPGLAFGNIFGSNLFNITILTVLDIIFIKKMILTHIKDVTKTNKFVIMTYIIILVPFIAEMVISGGFAFGLQLNDDILLFLQSFEIFGISYVSFVIAFVYYISLGALNERVTLLSKTKEEMFTIKEVLEEDEENDSKYAKYSIKQLVLIMIAASIVLVVASLLITSVTDQIATLLNLNASVAGALFLGIATSLPELTSTVTLARLGNYEAAAGGIIGSNMFNFVIIVAVDFCSRQNIISLIINDPLVKENAFILLILGLINSIILLLALGRGKKFNSKFVYIIPSILITANYVFYLLVSLL